MRKTGVLVLLASFCVIAACTNNKEEDLPNNCITTDMKYDADIKSILVENGCVGCHNAQSASGGIVLDNYVDVKANINKVLPSIKHDPNLSTSKYMPPGSKISQCSIDKIEAWVSDGTPQ